MHVLHVEPMPEAGSPSTMLFEDIIGSIVNGLHGRGWGESSWSAPQDQMTSYTIWCVDGYDWAALEAYLTMRPDVKEIKDVDGQLVIVLDLDYVDAMGLTYLLKQAGVDINQLVKQLKEAGRH